MNWNELEAKVKAFALKMHREKDILFSCERCYYLIDPKCPTFPVICSKDGKRHEG